MLMYLQDPDAIVSKSLIFLLVTISTRRTQPHQFDEDGSLVERREACSVLHDLAKYTAGYICTHITVMYGMSCIPVSEE